MDSLTHVILGAACGELVLGKKMGNRAMIWGSIGGSLPDFDVLANFITDPLNSMLFHRGPMHSLLFVLLVPFVLGPLLKWVYDRSWHKRLAWKYAGFIIGILLYLLASFLLCLIWSLLFDTFPWILMIILIVVAVYFFRKRYIQIFREEIEIPNATTKEWILLFSLSVLIHPLLDALTTYGTVLFWPFSNMRIAISSIAIADPLYTIPFAIFVMLAALEQRNLFRRKVFSAFGIGWSTVYLMVTFINKQHIDKLFESSLDEKKISHKEYLTVPTILNNLLWYGITKQDSGYVYSYYSLMDRENTFTNFHFVKGNHEVFDQYKDQDIIKRLPWFSNGYYNLIPMEDKKIRYNDLRFGSKNGRMDKPEDFIFQINLADKNGVLEMTENQKPPDNKREDIEWFKKRIVGKEK